MLTVISAGCIHSHQADVRRPVVAVPAQRVIVTEAPPPAKVEVEGTAPDDRHVWIPGYWMRGDNRWVWVPGHWEVRPRPAATWVPGQWVRDPDGKGWVWTPGHWR